MFPAVPALPVGGLGQAEVGAAVDDDGGVGQLFGDDGGVAVRQAEEHDVVAAQGLGVGGVEDAVGKREQVGMEFAEPRAGVATGGECTDDEPAVLVGGMPEEQTQDLAPRVPARPCDGDPNR